MAPAHGAPSFFHHHGAAQILVSIIRRVHVVAVAMLFWGVVSRAGRSTLSPYRTSSTGITSGRRPVDGGKFAKSARASRRTVTSTAGAQIGGAVRIPWHVTTPEPFSISVWPLATPQFSPFQLGILLFRPPLGNSLKPYQDIHGLLLIGKFHSALPTRHYIPPETSYDSIGSRGRAISTIRSSSAIMAAFFTITTLSPRSHLIVTLYCITLTTHTTWYHYVSARGC